MPAPPPQPRAFFVRRGQRPVPLDSYTIEQHGRYDPSAADWVIEDAPYPPFVSDPYIDGTMRVCRPFVLRAGDVGMIEFKMGDGTMRTTPVVVTRVDARRRDCWFTNNPREVLHLFGQPFFDAMKAVAQSIAAAFAAMVPAFQQFADALNSLPPEVLAALRDGEGQPEGSQPEESHTPDSLRRLLGAPGDGASAARFTSEGGLRP